MSSISMLLISMSYAFALSPPNGRIAIINVNDKSQENSFVFIFYLLKKCASRAYAPKNA